MIRAFILCLFATVLVANPVPAAANCPPGLAKKNPPCVPPGQAKKGVTTREWLQRGDRLDRDYDRVRDPWRYRLPTIGNNEGYYRDGRIVYRVDEQTRRVVDWILLTDAILND